MQNKKLQTFVMIVAVFIAILLPTIAITVTNVGHAEQTNTNTNNNQNSNVSSERDKIHGYFKVAPGESITVSLTEISSGKKTFISDNTSICTTQLIESPMTLKVTGIKAGKTTVHYRCEPTIMFGERIGKVIEHGFRQELKDFRGGSSRFGGICHLEQSQSTWLREPRGKVTCRVGFIRPCCCKELFR